MTAHRAMNGKNGGLKIKPTGVFMPPLGGVQISKTPPQNVELMPQVAKTPLVGIGINGLQELRSGKYTPHLLLPSIGDSFNHLLVSRDLYEQT